jgi:hypothetical protein
MHGGGEGHGRAFGQHHAQRGGAVRGEVVRIPPTIYLLNQRITRKPLHHPANRPASLCETHKHSGARLRRALVWPAGQRQPSK